MSLVQVQMYLDFIEDWYGKGKEQKDMSDAEVGKAILQLQRLKLV